MANEPDRSQSPEDGSSACTPALQSQEDNTDPVEPRNEYEIDWVDIREEPATNGEGKHVYYFFRTREEASRPFFIEHDGTDVARVKITALLEAMKERTPKVVVPDLAADRRGHPFASSTQHFAVKSIT